jgi:hypothetical protein
VARIGWSRIQKPQGRNDPAAFYFPALAQIVVVAFPATGSRNLRFERKSQNVTGWLLI